MDLVLCADATASIGTGHVMRCLALARAIHEADIPVRMIGRIQVPWVRQRLADEGISFTLIDSSVPERENPDDLLRQLGGASIGTAVVLDGYHFGLDCQTAVRAAGYRLLVIDDYAHLLEYSCDVLLNQNIGAEDLVYKGDIGRKLLGPQYALLRPEFVAARQKAEVRQFSGKVRNILLTLGGGDCSEHLARIAPNFSVPELQGRTLRVIAGGMPPERIRDILRNCPSRLEILERVEDMPALLLDTDLCVTAGGSTCWELCCLGVPFVVTPLAENQQKLTRWLLDCGIAAPLCALRSFFSEDSSGLFFRYSAKGRALVDGTGAARVISVCLEQAVSLRRAGPEDSEFLLNLVNNPELRKFAGNTHYITRQEHKAWFAARLCSRHSFVFIACVGKRQQPAGYIRFEEKDGTMLLSIALDPQAQGNGFGEQMIREGCRKVIQKSAGAVSTIVARVLENNPRALRVFEKTGFQKSGVSASESGITLVEMCLQNLNNLL